MPQRRAKPTVDRISSLPDEVICHILSFLPTKLAVATSILSNRWHPLWRSLTTLHFICEDTTEDKSYSLFNDFVFSVLLMRDFTQPIKRFHLKLGRYDSRSDASNIHKWVHVAVQHGLQHLHLDLYDYKYVILPQSILSCKTLIVLKLSSVKVNALPCDVDFPSLKILHLGSVNFRKHEYLIKFLNGCPILEDLKLGCLSLFDKHRDDREFNSLAKLVRADVRNEFIPLTLVRNAEFLRVKLECSYYLDISVFPNLTHLEIIFESYNWHWLVGVLRLCPQLQILVIENGFIRYREKMNQIYTEDWEDPQLVPDCLSSQLRTCTLSNCAGLECELQFARYVMKNSKSLWTMTISNYYTLSKEEKLQYLKKLTLCPRSSATSYSQAELDEHHNEGEEKGEVESVTKLVKADISNKSIPLTLLHNVGFLRAKLKGSYYLNVCEFRNLTHMDIIFKPYNWHWLVGVMRHCPQLQFLFIGKGFISDKKK